MSTETPLDTLNTLSPAKRALLLKSLQRQRAAAAPAAPRIPRREAQDDAPLSFAQQRLWFLDQLAPGDPSYNISCPVRLTGPLQPSLLRGSLGEIVRRHQSLRTRFVTTAGEARQSIEPFAGIALPAIDLRRLPPAVREGEVDRLARQDDNRPFSLSRPPLLRATLLLLAAAENVVLLAMHHIVADAWSLEVMARELTAIYRALAGGSPVSLPELPIQYADFAVWQRQRLEGERLARLVDYWRQRLAGAPTMTELPADRPRPARRSPAGAERQISLPAGLLEALRQLGQGRKVSLFMVGLAAFQALVHRYTGNRDLVIGTPLGGRVLVELEPLIGCFVNTLPLRTELAGDCTVGELLERVSEATTGAFEHQDLPFEVLVDELRPERSLSHSPIFQLVFVLNPGQEEPPAETAALALQPLRSEKTTSKFDLLLELSEGPGAVATAQFSTQLFDGATVDRLLGHYASLLTAFPAAPSQRLSELPLLSPAERHELLHDLAWGHRHHPLELPPDQPLQRLFEAQAARTPEAIAVRRGEVAWSYRELDRRANQLARHLQRRGVGPEVPVALCLERSPEQVLAILAVLKAGGAYVPIEPSMAAERIDYVLSDARIEHGVTHSSVVDRLPAQRTRWLCLDREAEAIARQSAELPAALTVSGSLAYLLYTSGSTGKPKGVLISHHNVARLLAANEDLYSFGPDDVWTFFHSYAFDVSVWEMWGALAHGGCLVVVPYLVSRSPGELYELLVAEGVTVLNQTPSAFRELMAVESARTAPLAAALRYVVFAGEALDFKSLEPWFERHGGERPLMVNMYGITETTVHTTWRAVSQGDAAGGIGSFIGFSIPDLAMFLVAPAGELAPFGAPAEIYIAGPGLARGYLRRPDLTAERFVPDPFSGAAGERLYRSGDLARWRSGGELEYLGRRDLQVKIRGFRVELAEIEAVLSEHPALAEVAVTVRRSAAGVSQLAAYIVSAASGLTAEELQRFARERLPDYMVPALFVLLPALPLTVNGKLDRAALPEPLAGRLAAGERYVAPRTATERELAAVWSEALRVDKVGALDNFFALGGDSILSVRLLAKAAERGLHFSLQQLFQHQTVAELAHAIQGGDAAPPAHRPCAPFELVAAAERPLLPAGLDDAYPLSRLQMGMLYHSELSPESALYHNVNSFHLLVPFRSLAFRAAAERLLARHPVLRSSFDLASWSEPLQLVHRSAAAPIEVVDLQRLPSAVQEAEIAAAMAGEKTRGFDWTRPPLLRFQIHLRSPDSFQFTLTEHHAILDGWSVTLFLTELFQRYLAELGRELPAAEPPPATGMSDFVRLEREAQRDQESQAFWDRQLAGVEILRLPRWHERRLDSRGDRIHSQEVPITAAASDGLTRLAAAAGAPVKSVLLAAHLRALAHLAGRFDVLTGLVAHGRPETVDGDTALGLFLNTMPFRQRLASGTWVELVRATFAAENAMLPHRRFPLPDIQARHDGASLLETAFNFVHFHAYEELGELPQLKVLSGEVFQQTHFTLLANFRLTLGSRRIVSDLQYDGRELGRAQVASIVDLYARILERMAEAPESRQEVFPLLAGGEPRTLPREGDDDAALAGALRAARRAGAQRAPLSFAQERLWWLDQLAHLDQGDPSYNLSCRARLSGPLDASLLRRSLAEILLRHESLRTAFTTVAGEPVQSLEPCAGLALPVVDLRRLPRALHDPELDRLARAGGARPFSLQHPPLLRATLVRLAADEQAVLLALHQIASDAWSVGVLWRDLAAIYSALSGGLAVALPELAVRYTDFAVGQRQWLQGETRARLVDAWRQRLDGAPQVTELPTDRLRPPRRGPAAAELSLRLSAALLASLRELARQRQVTLFTVGLAAFQALVHRYTGSRDLVIGTPFAGRDPVELEPLVGCFVNTLPLRASCAGDPAAAELVDRVAADAASAFAHRRLPFAVLLDELHRERGPSHAPIFQLVFALAGGEEPQALSGGLALQPLAIGSSGGEKTRALSGGLKLQPLAIGGSAGGLDLVLELSAAPPAVATARFSAALFDRATVARLLGHYANLLAALAADPSRPLSELPLLAPAERHQLLREPAGGAAQLPADLPLHRLFEAQALRAPLAPAVSAGETAWSYGELNLRANRLARHLRARGVGPEAPVALCLERSGEQVLAILAVLKAGGAYLALDPSAPDERLAFLLSDAGAEWGLTHAAVARRLPADRTRWICLDEEREAIARQGGENLDDPAPPDSLCYILYTSGSTGRPKGVLISHRHVARLLAVCAGLFSFGAGDVWTLFHSYSFDFSVWEMWGALAHGGRLVVVPSLLSRSPEAFYQLLVEAGVTVLNQTPSAFRELLAAEQARAGLPVASLRYVIFGGEALDYQSLEPWFARHGDRQPLLVNMYGITETTVHVTWRGIDSRDARGAIGSFIGSALPDLSLVLLGAAGELAPLGIPAEIHVGGAGLARGYLGQPSLTAERFVPDPFSATAGGRLYRTGDLARWRPGGELEYLGRRDHQVKVRGFRIELGEIEAALRQHESVDEAVVILRDEESGNRRLVAYVVGGPRQPSAAELADALRARLPAYMVPAAFVVLQELPLTVSGKVDRRALPAPSGERPELHSAYAAPQTATEATLAQIWAEVLRLDRVGIDDSLFAMGGDSMLSLQILSRARRAGLDFKLQALYQHQTIRELARHCEPPAAAPQGAAPSADEALWSELEGLSDDEVLSRLERLSSAAGADEA